MKTLFALIIIALIIKVCLLTDRSEKDPSRPSGSKKPASKKQNDKIILVDNANAGDIKKVLAAFCNLYNKDDFAAMPRLWELSPTSFAVTFPYDVNFSIFCFAVNYLEYPIDINWHADVKGWATMRKGDDWIINENIDKQAMLFIAADDTEHDNVFMTTIDNKGYKLDFAASNPKTIDVPKEFYRNPAITTDSLSTQKHEDFQ